MFRQVSRIGHRLACIESLTNYRCLSFGIRSPRHFSSAISADWPDFIKTFLERERIDQPTRIQELTLPIAMKSMNLVGVARTGSGKTLAFVIPAVMKILEERKALGSQANTGERLPTCLVLAPTRELASQTADVFAKFRNMGIRSIVLVGGASRSAQVNQLSYRDQDVYIATPGRLLDLIKSKMVDLSDIKYLVLDEADRMLDMGFEPQIRSILESVPEGRQTLMWSATWPREIQSLASDFMNDYEYIAVDSEKLKANPNINQIVEVCKPFDKLNLTLNYLTKFENESASKTLVFVNTKRLADQLLLQFMRNKRRAVSMHGDRSQRQRDEALRLFRHQSFGIMIATDVAARGLDINDITHVINYDFPNTIEDYIHRIGRTARHDKSGTSLSLFTINDINVVNKLLQVLRETDQDVPEALVKLAEERHKYIIGKADQSRARRPRNDFYSNPASRSSATRDKARMSNLIDEDDFPSLHIGQQRRARGGNVFDDERQ